MHSKTLLSVNPLKPKYFDFLTHIRSPIFVFEFSGLTNLRASFTVPKLPSPIIILSFLESYFY